MDNQPTFKIKAMYFVMLRLMDLESIGWDLADILIKPIVLVRRWVAYRISLVVKIK